MLNSSNTQQHRNHDCCSIPNSQYINNLDCGLPNQNTPIKDRGQCTEVSDVWRVHCTRVIIIIRQHKRTVMFISR